ncbi:unnamed protein product [Cuscuta epithymum]|uniref:HMA domain-containing protein n=1 Tax=Cuscuta epithymum TaxID=186058 RepID=A0AAV0FXS6_9ASTE|nr:unnamed protein product [Cuscuta epithymum]CAH9140129.1 unnamed protein product [Cuscuta epithymum]
MGIITTLEYLSEKLIGRIGTKKSKKRKRKQLSTVSIKIRMDCEGCVRKVRNVLSKVKGAQNVEVDMKQQKATVRGFVDAKRVMRAAKSTGKKCEIWPYVPYGLVAHPYMPGVYDKKAPPNYVRASFDPSIAYLDPMEQQFTLMFSDENPNACSIM